VAEQDWCRDPAWAQLPDRLADQDRLDERIAEWTREYDKFDLARALLDAGVPAAAVQRPHERIDRDPNTAGFGLWPTATHADGPTCGSTGSRCTSPKPTGT
jgi:benzylsuccinate CoA-transferase BbsF subunit